MNTVGAYEAKTHFSRLLDRVANGERITILRHGVPVAVLQPPEPAKKQDVRQAIEEMIEFRKGHRLDGLTIRQLIEEGRRY